MMSVVNNHSMRFWLAYLILPIQKTAPALLYDVDRYCVVHHLPDPTHLPYIDVTSQSSVPQGDNSTTNSTIIHVEDSNKPVSDDDEPFWIYIVITVVLALLLAVIILVLCIRFRKKKTENERVTDMLKRPLPEVNDKDKIDSVNTPILHETYSHVADEIPYMEDTDNPSSPTYAEIEEVSSPPKSYKKIEVVSKEEEKKRSDVEVISPDDSIYAEPDEVNRKSIYAEPEEVNRKSMYAEPEEIKRNSVYAEIEDKHPPKNSKDEKTAKKNRFNLFRNGKKDKEIKNKENIKTKTSAVSNAKQMERIVTDPDVDTQRSKFIHHYSECEPENDGDGSKRNVKTCSVKEKQVVDHTYAECENVVSKGDRKSTISRHASGTTDSDSDDDLIMTENEFYEPFEQAKV